MYSDPKSKSTLFFRELKLLILIIPEFIKEFLYKLNSFFILFYTLILSLSGFSNAKDYKH